MQYVKSVLDRSDIPDMHLCRRTLLRSTYQQLNSTGFKRWWITL